MAAGVVVFTVALILTGLQTHVVTILLAWVLASVGFSMASAGLFAAVADQVPVTQRGMISSAIFGPQALGLLVGLVLLTTVITSTTGGFVTLAVFVVALSVPFVLQYRETLSAATATPLNLRQAMWVSPRAVPGFRLGLQRPGDGEHRERARNHLSAVLLPRLPAAEGPRGRAAGRHRDLSGVHFAGRLHRWGDLGPGRVRRVFVAVASVLQGIAALILVVAPSFRTTEVAAAFLGAGYGAFLSVDQALVTQVLPNAGSRSKDLGVMNIGTNVPQALAPVAAALVIDQLGGYRALFGFAGMFTFFGVVMVYRIKSVK